MYIYRKACFYLTYNNPMPTAFVTRCVTKYIHFYKNINLVYKPSNFRLEII